LLRLEVPLLILLPPVIPVGDEDEGGDVDEGGEDEELDDD
jgi:hypothetical protein